MNFDQNFLQNFESGELPEKDFDHAAHVWVTWYYLSHFNFPDAKNKVRSGIKNFLKVKKLDSSIYNETITVVFIHLIEVARRSHANEHLTWDQFKASHSELFYKKNSPLFTYYRLETLQSKEAKLTFVTPDLRPLPRF